MQFFQKPYTIQVFLFRKSFTVVSTGNKSNCCDVKQVQVAQVAQVAQVSQISQ